jgi:hypothetical protein
LTLAGYPSFTGLGQTPIISKSGAVTLLDIPQCGINFTFRNYLLAGSAEKNMKYIQKFESFQTIKINAKIKSD